MSNPTRKRRTERYAEQQSQSAAVRTPQGKPADVSPARQVRTPQARQPIGRSAELQARQEQMRQSATAQPRRQLPAYSDFEQPGLNGSKPVRSAKRKKKKNQHTALWAAVSLVCLVTSGVLLLFAAPQMMDVSFASMPNFAFVNGSLIQRDQRVIDDYQSAVNRLNTDRIHNGVYIDGIHVGGMTRDEAVAAVSNVPGGAGSAFDIGINVEGYTWAVSSNNVPLYRNIEEVVMQAYAVGRSTSTSGVRAGAITPLSQRLSAVNGVLKTPVAFYTVTTYDRDAVRAIADSIAEAINREPVNATVAAFDQATKKFTFNSDESGVYVDADAIYNEVVSRLDSGVYSDTIYVEPQIHLADVTRADLMNSFGLVSSFTTKKTGNTNRTTNIALSAEAINGTTVLPGETFSFNRATGERTAAKGYKPAAAIAGGETVDEIGGGVCQTSSTLFNAVARANLTITSRKPHAWPSDYVPKGEDATVNWPNLDFKFTNDTDWPIFIVAWCDKSAKTVTVEIYGKSLGDGVTIDLESEVVYKKDPPSETLYVYNPELDYGTEKQTIKARTGYRVDTYKVFYQNGQEVSRELLHTSEYKMYQKTVEHNKPNVYGT